MREVLTAVSFWLREEFIVRKHVFIENALGCTVSAPLYRNSIEFPEWKVSHYDFQEDTSALNPDKDHIIKTVKVVPPGSERIEPDSSTLYLLLYNKKESKRSILKKYRESLLDGTITAVLFELPEIQILFGSTLLACPTGPLLFGMRPYVNLKEKMLCIAALLLLLFLVYFLNLLLVQAFEQKDPLYTDFVISSANLVKYKDIPPGDIVSCSICFDDFKGEDEVRLLECKHFYHPECVDRWLIGHSNCCPYCRQEISILERI